jgi:hypothetical protein
MHFPIYLISLENLMYYYIKVDRHKEQYAHKYCRILPSGYIFYCKVLIFWIDSTEVHKGNLISTRSHKTEILNCSYFKYVGMYKTLMLIVCLFIRSIKQKP